MIILLIKNKLKIHCIKLLCERNLHSQIEVKNHKKSMYFFLKEEKKMNHLYHLIKKIKFL